MEPAASEARLVGRRIIEVPLNHLWPPNHDLADAAFRQVRAFVVDDTQVQCRQADSLGFLSRHPDRHDGDAARLRHCVSAPEPRASGRFDVLDLHG